MPDVRGTRARDLHDLKSCYYDQYIDYNLHVIETQQKESFMYLKETRCYCIDYIAHIISSIALNELIHVHVLTTSSIE